jgi:hypothetical protein
MVRWSSVPAVEVNGCPIELALALDGLWIASKHLGPPTPSRAVALVDDE